MPRKPGETIAQVEQTELSVTTNSTSERVKTTEDVFAEQAEVRAKHLEIVMDKFNHYRVKWAGAQGGAPIPKVLEGSWTRKDRLEELIKRYMQERDG